MASVTTNRHQAVGLSMTSEGAGDDGNEVNVDK
jgi:hypothetical protein